MESDYPHTLTPQERAQRHAQRKAARKRKLHIRRRKQLRRMAPFLLAVLAVVILVPVGYHLTHQSQAAEPEGESSTSAVESSAPAASSGEAETSAEPVTAAFAPRKTAKTVELGEEFPSGYAIMIDVDSGEILAEKGGETVISPASMTKILTVLVAAEQVTDLDDTFTITTDITDFCYQHDCSAAGFADGETVTVRDLFYGTVLPSGGDAALALATYVAGSQDAFVRLMNNKLQTLGLSDTAHFTNCIGLYHEDHYCTAYDMAVMLEAAMQNDLCRQVLSAHTYTTSVTPQHPEGIPLSNWFLRRIEDKDMGDVAVQCAKTGFVNQAGSCAASYGTNGDKAYICVTASAYSAWRCIYDHVALYKTYGNPIGGGEEATAP